MNYCVKYNRVYDKNDNIVNIKDVNESNKEEEYYSIGSHTPMIAAIGNVRQHYFRAKRGYSFDPETELHQYVKKMLKYRFDTQDKFIIKYRKKEICSLREKCIFFDFLKNQPFKIACDKTYISDDRFFEYDLKKYYDTATIEGPYDGYVADVLLTHSKYPERKPIFLEVAVSHPCTEEKINSDNKIIEIYVRSEEDADIDLYQKSKSDIDYYGERVKFYNFKEEEDISKGCQSFVETRKYARQKFIIQSTPITTKFYCSPQTITNNPLQSYFDNAEIGMLFASNEFAKPFVFEKRFCLEVGCLVILGKDIYGAVKPWVVYRITWNGKYHEYRYRVKGYFSYYDAYVNYKLAQKRDWKFFIDDDDMVEFDYENNENEGNLFDEE